MSKLSKIQSCPDLTRFPEVLQRRPTTGIPAHYRPKRGPTFSSKTPATLPVKKDSSKFSNKFGLLMISTSLDTLLKVTSSVPSSRSAAAHPSRPRDSFSPRSVSTFLDKPRAQVSGFSGSISMVSGFGLRRPSGVEKGISFDEPASTDFLKSLTVNRAPLQKKRPPSRWLGFTVSTSTPPPLSGKPVASSTSQGTAKVPAVSPATLSPGKQSSTAKALSKDSSCSSGSRTLGKKDDDEVPDDDAVPKESKTQYRNSLAVISGSLDPTRMLPGASPRRHSTGERRR